MARALQLTTPHMRGNDVERLQRLLRGKNRWGKNFHPGPADGEYGPKTAAAVKAAKWYLGYPASRCNRRAGGRLVAFLEGTKRLPVAYALRKRRRARRSIRERIVAEARWGIRNEPRIHYAQVRPINYGGWARHRLPWTGDCSSSITAIFKKAGAPDPNGRKYDGSGYTGTMLANLRHISKDQLRPGDLVIFGGGTGSHVVLVMTNEEDPMVFSHGQERGPMAYRLSVGKAAFPGAKVTYLSAGV